MIKTVVATIFAIALAASLIANYVLYTKFLEVRKDKFYWIQRHNEVVKNTDLQFKNLNQEIEGLADANDDLVSTINKLKSADYIVDHTVRNAIQRLSEVHTDGNRQDDIYVIEEATELQVELQAFVKLLCKNERNSIPVDHLIEESCDVLTTVLTLLYNIGVTPETVNEKIVFKSQRAVDRFEERGKL